MKKRIKPHFKKKFFEQAKMYGATTIGARGQIVIPSEARKDLKLKPGDRLLVMSKFCKSLGLIKAEELNDFVNIMMKQVNDKDLKNEIKRQTFKTLGI